LARGAGWKEEETAAWEAADLGTEEDEAKAGGAGCRLAEATAATAATAVG
jgi:hypothetical protein